MEIETSVPTNSNNPLNHFIRVFCPEGRKKNFINLLQQAIYYIEEETLIEAQAAMRETIEKRIDQARDLAEPY